MPKSPKPRRAKKSPKPRRAKVKAVKAWAVPFRDGSIDACDIHASEEGARVRVIEGRLDILGIEPFPVLISPLPRSRK